MKRKYIILLVIVIACSTFLWGCMPSSPPRGWSGPAVANVSIDDSSSDLLFYGAMEGKVIALDNIADHAYSKWRYPDESTTSYFYGTPLYYNGIVYAGGYSSGKVYALDAGHGFRLWSYPEEGDDSLGAIVGSPVIEDGILYIGSSDRSLYAVNTSNRQLEWAPFETGGEIWASPLVYNGVVYIGSFDHKMYAVDAASGAPAWQSPFETRGAIVATATEYNGSIYFGTCDRKLYAVDAATGQAKAGFTPFQAGNWFWGRAIANNDTIYAASLDGRVYALNAESGTEKWTAETGSPIRGDPAFIQGMILVGTEDGRVYAFDAASGNEAWSTLLGGETPTQVRASLLAHVNSEGDAVVYVHAANQRIYALDAEDGHMLWRYPSE
jgi:outer membrane protein assembly factor BamB